MQSESDREDPSRFLQPQPNAAITASDAAMAHPFIPSARSLDPGPESSHVRSMPELKIGQVAAAVGVGIDAAVVRGSRVVARSAQ